MREIAARVDVRQTEYREQAHLLAWQTAHETGLLRAIHTRKGRRVPSINRLFREYVKELTGEKISRRKVELEDPDMKEMLRQSRERVKKAREEKERAG